MAQLVARFHGMEEVRGSNPLSSTFCFPGSSFRWCPGISCCVGCSRDWVADVNAFSVLGRQYRHRSPVFGRIIGDVCRHRQPHRALRRKGCGYPSRLYDRSPLPSQPGGYRTFGVSFGAVFCCVGAVVRVLKLGWPGFMGGQKVCLGSGFFVVVPRDKSV